MSLNEYNPTTGELTNIASSSRIWTGTKDEWNALVQAGTAPRNVLVAITDDEQDPSERDFTVDKEVEIGKMGNYKVYRKVQQFEVTSTGAKSLSFDFSSDAVAYLSVRGMIKNQFPLQYYGAATTQTAYFFSIYDLELSGAYKLNVPSGVGAPVKVVLIVEYIR